MAVIRVFMNAQRFRDDADTASAGTRLSLDFANEERPFDRRVIFATDFRRGQIPRRPSSTNGRPPTRRATASTYGHSTIVLTLDTYQHVLPHMQRGAADKLEAMMFGPGAY